MSAEEQHDDGDDGEVEQTESTAEFQAVVTLPANVHLQTGEEDEEVIYKHRCKLHRFAAESKEWKERGTGDIKLLKNQATGMIRAVMRQEKTNKLVLNHFVHPLVELKSNPGSDSTWTWTAEDFSEGAGSGVADTFAVRFKTAEIAGEYKAAHTTARKQNENPVPVAKKAAAAEESKEDAPAAAAAASASHVCKCGGDCKCAAAQGNGPCNCSSGCKCGGDCKCAAAQGNGPCTCSAKSE